MTMLFERKRIKPNFVKEVYSQIIANGFNFKSGYWFHKKANIDEIIEWNQKLLDNGFKLSYTQHVKHDYMQILFESKLYSELRGFWIYSDEEVTFNLIVPESDILNCEGGSHFIRSKLDPLKKLATNLWDCKIVDVIQTSVELDEGYYPLSNVQKGDNISVNPFAILSESTFSIFPNNYFDNMSSYRISNSGVFIESDGTILHHV